MKKRHVLVLATTLAVLASACGTASRPFLFIIKHRTTNEILFIGRVVDPTA